MPSVRFAVADRGHDTGRLTGFEDYHDFIGIRPFEVRHAGENTSGRSLRQSACCDLAGALHGRALAAAAAAWMQSQRQNQQTKGIHCADSAPVGGLDFLENAVGFLIQIKLSAN
jgi:hypothetical protein